MDMHSGTFNPQDFAWQGLTLTPAAAVHIRELVAKQPGMIGVRLGVKQTGCALRDPLIISPKRNHV